MLRESALLTYSSHITSRSWTADGVSQDLGVASVVQKFTIPSTFSARTGSTTYNAYIHMERGDHEECDGDFLFLIACVDIIVIHSRSPTNPAEL